MSLSWYDPELLMGETAVTARAFDYRAQTAGGEAVSGSVRASDRGEAAALLEQMHLDVVEIAQAREAGPSRPLRGEDFLTFNQQLAYLTQAGLPVERGLRLIARETKAKRLSQTIHAVAERVESGVPLAQAFNEHRRNFPPLYGRIIDAGVKTANLPAVLFSVGAHLEMLGRLRSAIWQTLAYPLMLVLGLAGVLTMLSIFIFPQFQAIYADFDAEVPWLTQALIGSSSWLAWVFGAIVLIALTTPLVWRGVQYLGYDQMFVDGFVLPLPLIGPVIQRTLIARWADTLRLGVEAGLDLPAGLDLASKTIASPSLELDGQAIGRELAQGRGASQARDLALVPSSVTAAIDLASGQGRLPDALASLTALYARQAEARLNLINVVLLPILLVPLAVFFCFLFYALLLPMIDLMQSVI